MLELIAGLARTEQVRLTAIVPNRPAQHALARLRNVPGLKLATYGEAPTGPTSSTARSSSRTPEISASWSRWQIAWC